MSDMQKPILPMQMPDLGASLMNPDLNTEVRAQIMQQLHELSPYLLGDSKVFIVIEKQSFEKPEQNTSKKSKSKTLQHKNLKKKFNLKNSKKVTSVEQSQNIYTFKLSLTGAGAKIESSAQSEDLIVASIEAKNKMIEYLDGVHKQLSAEANDVETLLPMQFTKIEIH